jgi:multiple sugar transport system permease protein
MRVRRLPELILTYAVVLAGVFVLAFPFYWMAMTTFKSDDDLYNPTNAPFFFNKPPTLGNLHLLLFETPYPHWVANTVIVGVVVALITVALALPAGYALARLSGRMGQRLGVAIFLTYLIPPTLLFLPLSRVVSLIHLEDSLGSLMLVYPSFTVPFATWLLMGFFKTIPRDMEEAALVDGCTRLGAIVRIVFPLSLPGILTVIIFSFTLVVNEFIYALTFISSSSHMTISVGVPTELIRGDVFYWGALEAAALLPSIPLALLYNAFLNRFIAGFTAGAVR